MSQTEIKAEERTQNSSLDYTFQITKRQHVVASVIMFGSYTKIEFFVRENVLYP
jgi:hypothetical protein